MNNNILSFIFGVIMFMVGFTSGSILREHSLKTLNPPTMTQQEYHNQITDLRMKIMEEDFECEIFKLKQQMERVDREFACVVSSKNYKEQLRDLVKHRDYYLGTR